MLLLLALLAGVFGLTLSVIDRGPWLFMVLWLAVISGVAFGLLIFTCYEVLVTDGTLTWRSAFRHGRIPMDQLDRIAAWPGGSIHVFEFRGGQRIRIAVMQGYVTFLEKLHQEYPQLPLPPSVYARFVNRVRFGRGDDRSDDVGPA